MTLNDLVRFVAHAMTSVDSRRPVQTSRRGRVYQPGIGPFSENSAMALVIAELQASHGLSCGQFAPYPSNPRQKCDLWFGAPPEWLVEVKMARFRGDNGKPDDTAIKDLISPFPADRSALTDGLKLGLGGFLGRTALMIYGFDDPERPLDEALAALETLLARNVRVGERREAPLDDLVHPVHRSGRVTAWEVLGPAGNLSEAGSPRYGTQFEGTGR